MAPGLRARGSVVPAAHDCLPLTAQSTVPRPPDTPKPRGNHGSASSGHRSRPPAQPDERRSTTIRVNVKLVNVFSTVTTPAALRFRR